MIEIAVYRAGTWIPFWEKASAVLAKPTARFVYIQDPASYAVTFDGSASTASTTGDSIVLYSWDFGDNTSAYGPQVTQTYARLGTYTVRLAVTDTTGGTSISAQTVTIRDLTPPTASFTLHATHLGVTFDATASTAKVGSILSYAWDFGDGVGLGSGVTASYTYPQTGTYSITLLVTDTAGNTATALHTVSVAAAPLTALTAIFTVTEDGTTVDVDGSQSFSPTLSGGGATTIAPTAVVTHTESALTSTLSGSGSQPGSSPIVSYSWDFGDSTTDVTTTPSVAHTYPADGTYSATLIVTDRNGFTSTSVAPITVTSGSVPTPPPSGWVLNWSEEFSGTAIDTATWTVDNKTTFGHNTATEISANMAANLTLAGSILTMKAKKETTPIVISGDTRFPSGRTYSGAHLSTAGKKTFTFGATPIRIETRMRMPAGPGLHDSAVWLRPVSGTIGNYDGAEIDVAESNTKNLTTITQSVHQSYVPKVQAGLPATVDDIRKWHVYAAEISSTKTDFFIDGVKTSTVTSAQIPAYATIYGTDRAWLLHLTMSVGGTWPGNPTTATVFPASQDVDYIKVYYKATDTSANPIAAFVSAVVGASLSLDATGASAPGGTIASYAWNFGDGKTGSGARVTHTYTTSGTYPVQLTVTDNGGRTATLIRTFTITVPAGGAEPTGTNITSVTDL